MPDSAASRATDRFTILDECVMPMSGAFEPTRMLREWRANQNFLRGA